MARFIDEISIDGDSSGVSFYLCENGDIVCQMDFNLRTLDGELMDFDWDWVAGVLDENRVLYSWDEDIRVSYSYNAEGAAEYLNGETVIAFFEAAINGADDVDFEDCARDIDYALNKALR